MGEETATLFYIFISLLSALLFLYFLIPRKTPLKSPPPTLPSLPIIGHLHLLRHQPLHRALAGLSSLHGLILLLRFGSRPTLVISSASLAQSCSTTSDIAFEPPPAPRRKDPWIQLHHGWAPYGPLFRDLRCISTLHLLSSLRVTQFAPIKSRHVKTLIKNLYSEKIWILKVEMKSRLLGLTYGVMMEMIGAEEEEEARGTGKSWRRCLRWLE